MGKGKRILKHTLMKYSILKKLKLIFSTLLFLTIISFSAQETNALNDKLKLIQKPRDYKFTTNSTAFSKVKNFKFYLATGYTLAITINGKNIHFKDFNNDGLKDTIYQDTERYWTLQIFINKGDYFSEIWCGPGKLIAVKEATETAVYVIKYAVGCDDMLTLTKVTIHKDNSLSQSAIGHHYKTIIKDVNGPFETKIVSGILRIQPIRDDKPYTNPCLGILYKCNQIRTL